jgi:hypothetical protein
VENVNNWTDQEQHSKRTLGDEKWRVQHHAGSIEEHNVGMPATGAKESARSIVFHLLFFFFFFFFFGLVV